MSKRISAILCTLAIFVAAFAAPAAAAETTDSTAYQVGYEKKDLNPWVAYEVPGTGETLGIPAGDYSDASTNIVEVDIHTYNGTAFTGETTTAQFVKIPLSGYGNTDRFATSLTDDNGDGYVGYGDGIFVTCTSVTDSNGTTVMYLSLDGTNTNAELVRVVRLAIVDALGSDVISNEQIMVSSSHSHAGPAIPTCRKAAAGTAYRAYYDYVVAQMTAAAVEAYQGRSAATMSKGQINASASMGAMGYTDANGDGLGLNFVRHYNTTGTLRSSTVIDNGNGGLTYNGWTVEQTNRALVTTPHTGQAFRQPESSVGLGGTIHKVSIDGYTGHVSDVDETLYVLQFQREDGDPIVLINWRAHATMNGNSAWGNISSDYINALRYRLENNKTKFNGTSDYCVGFWQGAAGNVNAGSSIASENGWKNAVVSELNVPLESAVANDPFYSAYYDDISGYADDFYYCAKYGYLLAKVSLDCLDSEMTSCAAGEIKNMQLTLALPKQEFDAGLVAAAEAWETNGGTFPYAYVHTDGKTYVLNSKYHANKVLTISGSSSNVADLELNVITLGDGAAMVTIPNEPFDRYSDAYVEAYTAAVEAGTVVSQWDSLMEIAINDNDWLDLVGDTYGMPFVLGYSNASFEYLPNAIAYDYHTFAESDPFYGIYGPGSYESNTATTGHGSGEQVVATLGEMLWALDEGYALARCEACDAMVAWAPLTQAQVATDMTSGHYYLAENIVSSGRTGQKSIGASSGAAAAENVCLDLNGYTWTHTGRIFTVYDSSTLSIMDSKQNGKLVAKSGTYNTNGGMILVNANGTLNLHSGILQFEKITEGVTAGREVGRGGVVASSGIFNMYGGTVIGGDLELASSSVLPNYNGVGGAIAILGRYSVFNMSGGSVVSGSVPEGGKGACIFVSSNAGISSGSSAVNLSGNAQVDEICFETNLGSQLNISGRYTGETVLRFEPDFTADSVDIGNVSSDAAGVLPDISDAALSVKNSAGTVYTQYTMLISGSNLMLVSNANAD